MPAPLEISHQVSSKIMMDIQHKAHADIVDVVAGLISCQ